MITLRICKEIASETKLNPLASFGAGLDLP